MKKTLCILAVMAMAAGLFSCEAETNVQETETFFESMDQNAIEGKKSNSDDRE